MQEDALRWYQKEAVAGIMDAMRAGNRSVLYQLPTAGGKSPILAALMHRSAIKRKRVLAIVHRWELVKQLARHFADWGHSPHILAAGGDDDPTAMVTVASVQTAARRKLSSYDLILVDEAHHACAGQWDRVLKAQPKAWTLGVTATPRRLDGKGLDGHFSALVQGPHARKLTKEGFLAPLEPHCTEYAAIKQLRMVNDNFRPEDLERILADYTKISLDEYERIIGKLVPSIFFCASVRHCQYVHDALTARAISSVVLTGDMKDDARREALRSYAAGEVTALIACDLIDEGLDIPETVGIVQLRPTESLVKHFQQIGRGMRPKGDGGKCILLDMAGNVARIKRMHDAGLPTEVMEWSLEGRPVIEKKAKIDDREVMKSEQEVDPSAVARRATIMVDRFANASTLREALNVVEEPRDFHLFRQNICNAKGKKYHVGAIVQFCRNRFFSHLGWDAGLDAAAKALGYERALQNARQHMLPWAVAGRKEAA